MRSLSWATLLTAVHLSQAIDVYLSPQHAVTSDVLSPQHASSALALHLGFEAFEPLHDASNPHQGQTFIGKGPRNALLLTINEEDVEAILPPSLEPSFKLSTTYNDPEDSLTSVLHTYLHRAPYSFSSVYGGGTIRQLEDVDSLSSFYETVEAPSFAALEVAKLSDLRKSYGSRSDEYQSVAKGIRRFLDSIHSKPNNLRIAIITFSTSMPSLAAREKGPGSAQSQPPISRPSPQEPIGSLSTCFSSENSCDRATNSCSGRGRCLKATKAGRTCFVCTCDVTRIGQGSRLKTETWAGQSCERKDVSGPFVLLSGTAVVLVLLIFGSVSLLSSVGDKELPSTLLATAVHVKKD